MVKVLGKENLDVSTVPTEFLYSACISSAGQLFPFQYKGLVGIEHYGNLSPWPSTGLGEAKRKHHPSYVLCYLGDVLLFYDMRNLNRPWES